MARDWLDSQGRLLFGKYGPKSGRPGLTVPDVLREDGGPGYIRWALENAEDMAEGDREIMTQYMKLRGRM